ncbi:MAG: hypothetical protein FJ299_12810 [Planctomycetes bacterium]|nr:hypothetical protein [Planctomycetota bacterium]
MQIEFTSLLLPALVSAALVFVASSLIHMVIKWHNSDYRKLSNEDEVRAVLNKGGASAGQYIVPHCNDSGAMADPQMQQRFQEGPLATLWLRQPGPLQIGPFLVKWFVYTFVVSLLVGYLAGITCTIGAPYRTVFHVVSVAAWLAYAGMGPTYGIWKGLPRAVIAKEAIDGLVYAGLTAGAFAWLWPR